MTEIKRYDMEKEYSLDINVLPVEGPDGSFVRYDDHDIIVDEKDARIAGLQEQVLALAAENAALIAGIEDHGKGFTECPYCRSESDNSRDDVCRILNETPATDAALREIRALGVEALRDSISDIDNGIETTIDLHHYCTDFAAIIRAGEQS